MKEFVDKLISRLEEEIVFDTFDHYKEEPLVNMSFERLEDIITQLSEEYINTSTNTSTDTSSGWIPCSERLPQESEPVCTLCEVVNVMLKNGIVTSGWCNRYLEKWYVLDHYHDYPLPYEYKDVIAWQPLPQPYKPQKNEWKDAVMKHFTNVE